VNSKPVLGNKRGFAISGGNFQLPKIQRVCASNQARQEGAEEEEKT